jgi:uncharacterized protein (AIM24 family)
MLSDTSQIGSSNPAELGAVWMRVSYACAGAFAAVECAVLPGDIIKAEAGAMVTMSNNVDIEAKIEGSTGDALLRCCCAGESLFMTHFSLKPGMVCICSHTQRLILLSSLWSVRCNASQALKAFIE